MQKDKVALKRKAQAPHFGFRGICLVLFKAVGRLREGNFPYCYIRSGGSASVLQDHTHGGGSVQKEQLHKTRLNSMEQA